jgi:protocatechuate 3,4-dioxygenase beta subunit
MQRRRAAGSLSFLLSFLLCLGLSVASNAESASGPLAEKGRSIIGTVTDPAGRPLPGAEVELTRALGGFPACCGSLQDQEHQEVYHARTDPTGRFEVRGLPTSWFDLRIDHPGFAPLTRNGIVVPDAAGAVDVGKLTLDAGRKIDGVVVDAEGRPRAGTAIWIRSMDRSSEGYPFLRRGPRQVTGADGRFSIHVEPKGLFELYACGRDRSRLIQVLDGTPHPLRIVLPASGRVPGRVVDSEGHPVAGARVSAAMEAVGPPSDIIDLYNPCPQTNSNAAVTTDAKGRFVLGPIAQGVFWVWVSADDFAPYTQTGAQLGGAGGLRNLDIVLRRGASLTGQVRSVAGAPVPGASIHASCPEGGADTSTGPDGRYRLSSLPPGGTCRLSARADRFNSAEATVEVKAAENHLDLRLEPIKTVEIRGRVIGAAGEPVAGAGVESRGALDGGKSLTAPDGSFTVETFAGSSDCALSVWKEGYAAYRSQSVPCDEAAAKEAVIRLERALTLTGRLLHLDPEQLATARVSAGNDSFYTPRSSVSPDGTYRIGDLGPGEWKVSAVADRRIVEGQVTLRRGQEDATLDLSFHSQFPVRGRVFGPDGEGIAGAWVAFSGAGYFSDSVDTQEDGSFEILLENGSYEFKAGAPSGPNAPTGDHWFISLPPITVADAPLEGIDIHLKKGVALHGCIPGLLPGEHPGILASHQGTTWAPEIGADGCYRLQNLEPGDWLITARLQTGCLSCLPMFRDGNDRKIERHVTVAPDASETALDLDLALGDRTLTVRPAGADKPGELYLRLLFPDGGALVEYAGQGRDGAFHVPRLRAGDYQIQIMDRKDQVLLKRSVELTSDQEMVVEVP